MKYHTSNVESAYRLYLVGYRHRVKPDYWWGENEQTTLVSRPADDGIIRKVDNKKKLHKYKCYVYTLEQDRSPHKIAMRVNQLRIESIVRRASIVLVGHHRYRAEPDSLYFLLISVAKKTPHDNQLHC